MKWGRDLRRAGDAPVKGSLKTPLWIPTGSLKDPHGPFQGDADDIIFRKFPKTALVAPNRVTGILAWGRNSTLLVCLPLPEPVFLLYVSAASGGAGTASKQLFADHVVDC